MSSKPVLQPIRCLICQGAIPDLGGYRCQRCGKICEVMTHEELPVTEEPQFFFIDWKSKCCEDDVDVLQRSTCSPACHEIYVQALIVEFGEYKKVADVETGISYRVPTRLIVEEGLKFSDLSKFPVWEETWPDTVDENPAA